MIKVEKYQNKNGVTQCYNCQAFGHGSSNCHIKPKCVKCAGDHTTASCTKTTEQLPNCVNCNLEHTANYSGCTSLQNYMIQKQLKIQKNALSNVTTNNRFLLLQDNQQFPTINNNNNNNKKAQGNNNINNNQKNNGSSQQLKQQTKHQQIQQLKQQIQQSNAQLQQLCNQALEVESNTPSYAEIVNMGSATTSSTATSFKSTRLSANTENTVQQQSTNNNNMQTQGESFSDLLKTLVGFISDVRSLLGFDISQFINKIKTFIFQLKNSQGSKFDIALEIDERDKLSLVTDVRG